MAQSIWDSALWTKATVRFNVEVHHNLVDYGNSTRGCDAVCANTVRDVYLVDYDSSAKSHLVDMGYYDIIPLSPEEFTILSLGDTTKQHPTKIIMEQHKNAPAKKNLTELMKELKSAIPNWFPSLMYSDFTEQWYVSAPEVYMRDNDLMGDVTIGDHKNTPEEAVEAVLDVLKKAPYFYNTLKSVHDRIKQYPVRFYKYNQTEQKFQEIERPEGYVTAEDVIETEFWTTEELVKKLESRLDIHPGVLGTTIQRVMMDKKVLWRHDLTLPAHLPQNKECYSVWCVAVGAISEPKTFFYGFTIKEALDKAVLAVLEFKGQPPTEADKMRETLYELSVGDN